MKSGPKPTIRSLIAKELGIRNHKKLDCILNVGMSELAFRCIVNELLRDQRKGFEDMSSEKTRAWKLKKFWEQNICLYCSKNPVGGKGGTKTACPECAQRKRDSAKRRYRNISASRAPKPPVKAKPEKRESYMPGLAMTEAQWQKARRPASSVTWNELSSGASNA